MLEIVQSEGTDTRSTTNSKFEVVEVVSVPLIDIVPDASRAAVVDVVSVPLTDVVPHALRVDVVEVVSVPCSGTRHRSSAAGVLLDAQQRARLTARGG